ncbi:AAA family ATPase [Nocardiopsis quinghaiensis]|uniref:AAA family ATPase n=1 Tax=Nocardiopsis quinghaiensis TaxID=464995 RepID=UPI001239626E|nr:AAA family ATPase [Nocardiopsis quinghaiensis]
MIKRITHVKDFRCYRKWRQNPRAIDFQGLNVIYAPNGTGKSTLAALLHGVPDDKEWSHGLKALIQPGDDEAQREKVEGPHWIWGDVCLFSADYVRRNLRFDSEDPETGAPALMYLGELSVEQRQRREEAQQRLQETTLHLEELRKRHRTATRNRQNTVRTVGGRAVNELAPFNSRFRRGFDGRHVEQALATPLTPPAELEQAGEQDRALLGGHVWKQVPPVTGGVVSTRDLWQQVNAVRRQTVMSVAIEELAEDRSHADWVGLGLKLHTGRDTCLFCDSRIEETRLRRLEGHFDESHARLEEEIAGVRRRIDALRQQASQLLAELPRDVQFFEHLRRPYEHAIKQVQTEIDDLLLGLDRLAASLEEKRASMFGALSPVEEDAVAGLDLDELNGIIEAHNEGTQTHEADRARAAERQFQRMLHEIRDTWQGFREEQDSLDEEIDGCQAVLRECRETLMETPEEGPDPHHFLPMLNTDIASLLRRRELTFDHVDGHYRVLRDGEPARNLSEGEKTAIALLYFLQSLNEKNRDLSRTIVVVDDPVSSLDDHLMEGVYATLVTRLDPGSMCRQLFVLTHSTAFLRYWKDDLTRGKREKRAEKATLHFMKSVVRADPGDTGRTTRDPVLVPIDLAGPGVDALSSEYTLVFHRAAWDLLESLESASVSADVRLASCTPNDARKLLEHFLQFKFPKQGENLTAAIEQALVDDPVRLQRLKKYVHGNSHRSPRGSAWQILDPDTRDAISDVFALIHQTDPDHLEGMCDRLGLTDHLPQLIRR